MNKQTSKVRVQGSVSRKFRKHFRPEKLFMMKPQPALSKKLVFSEDVKGIKIKITAKFRASRRLPFECTRIIMSPEIRGFRETSLRPRGISPLRGSISLSSI